MTTDKTTSAALPILSGILEKAFNPKAGAPKPKVAAKAKPKSAAKAKSKAKPKAKPKAAAKAKPKVAAKSATPKAPKPLDAKVVALIALLKTAKGATNGEAAEALKLKATGKGAHQTPVAQVRAMIRDKVRKLHTVTAGDHDAERGGIVQRIKS